MLGRKFTSILLGLGLTAVSLSACKFKTDKDDTDDEPVIVDPSTPVSFAEIREQILEPSCFSCHSAAGGNLDGVNLETYVSVKALVPAIKSSTVDSRRMPKGDTLSANKIALLQSWIEQGAPE